MCVLSDIVQVVIDPVFMVGTNKQVGSTQAAATLCCRQCLQHWSSPHQAAKLAVSSSCNSNLLVTSGGTTQHCACWRLSCLPYPVAIVLFTCSRAFTDALALCVNMLQHLCCTEGAPHLLNLSCRPVLSCTLCTVLQVKSRQLWGDEVYTDDSDVVAVLLHLGYYAASNVTCNPLIARFYAQVNLLPPQEQYLSATRNAVRSRCWFAKTEGCSFQVRGDSGAQAAAVGGAVTGFSKALSCAAVATVPLLHGIRLQLGAGKLQLARVTQRLAPDLGA